MFPSDSTPPRSTLDSLLDELVRVREKLVEEQLIVPWTPQAREEFCKKFQLKPDDADELLVDLVRHRFLDTSSLNLDDFNRLRRMNWKELASKLERAARDRVIPEHFSASYNALDGESNPPLSVLPSLVMDAVIRQRQKSLLLQAVKPASKWARFFRNNPGKVLAGLVLFFLIGAFLLRGASHDVNIRVEPEPPTPVGHVQPPSQIPSGLNPSDLRTAEIFSTVALVLILGGVVLAVRPGGRRGKTAGAVMALSGLSLFAFKDTKLFGSLIQIEKLAISWSKPSPALAPVLRSAAKPCIVGPFASGIDIIPTQANTDRSSLAGSARECATAIESGGAPEKLFQVILVGHVDRRELGTHASRTYGDNLTLAYRRALAVRQYVLDHQTRQAGLLQSPNLELRIVVLAAGPKNVGLNLDQEKLASDRSVEVLPYWLTVESEQEKNVEGKGPPS